MIETFVPPRVIECGGENLREIFKTFGKNCLLIGPEEVYEKNADIFKSALAKITVIYPGFSGEASEEEIKRLLRSSTAGKSEFIAAFGGGKAMDAAKSVSAKTGLPLIALPTSASTCASFTSHSVIYAEDGRFLYEEKHFTTAKVLILVAEILAAEPARLIASGIADACAKYYEFTFANNASSLSPYFDLSKELIKRYFSYAPFLKTNDERKIMEICRLNIITTGLISAFGGKEFRSSLAHATANGITQIFPAHPALRKLLHGELVGLGILASLFSLRRIDELITLRNFFESIGLFKELNSQTIKLEENDFLAASNYAVKSEPLFEKMNINPEDTARALNSLKLF